MEFDVAIVGGGLVGAALARALRGAAVALIAAARPLPPGEALDSRIYAISPGNAGFLAELQAWQRLPQSRIAPVRAMHVHGEDGAALLQFDAYRAGVPELAWIVEDGCLQHALWRGLETQDRLEIFEDAACERLEIDDAQARVRLADGRVIAARLIVGADGARSVVREQAGIACEVLPYEQTAVVANFRCAKGHGDAALQWFQGGPVLALLPLPADHVSMVWSAAAGEAARLLSLSPEDLAREVERATDMRLGALSQVTPARGFPLQRLRAQRLAAPRVALVGDAAHVVHPLAGQGANLGFQDARDLARVLAAREPGRDPGELRLLRRYERARAEDILAMRTTVHGLFSLFGARGAAVGWLRNAGCRMVDRVSFVKNLLVRQAMS